MKNLILLSVACAAILFLSACTTVEEPRTPSVHTTTTTTEESLHRPIGGASETRTFRSY